MQSRSDTWKTLAETGTCLLKAIAVIGGVEYTATSAPVISRGLFSDSLSVGNCTTASLSFSILTEDEIEKSAEVQIKQQLLESIDGTESEWLPAGTYYITNRSQDYSSGLLTLQCYDAMLKAQQNYFESDDDIDTSEWPKPMADVIDAIAGRMGVEVDDRTEIRTEDRYKVSCPKNLTMMDVLGYIGAVHGGNWIISPEGKLRLVPLATAPTDASSNVMAVTAVLGSLTTGRQLKISKITMTDSEGTGYTSGNDSGFELTINGNPYATQEICDDLYTTLHNVEYNPFTISKAIYDPAAELGDPILYNGLVYSFIAKEDATLNVSFQSNISAPSNAEVEDEYPYLSSTEKAISSLTQEVEETQELIEEVEENLQIAITQAVSDSEANITSAISATYATKTYADETAETAANNAEAAAKEYAGQVAANAEAAANEATDTKLLEYSTSTEITNEIAQAVSKSEASITSTLEATYATKTYASEVAKTAASEAETAAEEYADSTAADAEEAANTYTDARLKSYSTTTEVTNTIEQYISDSEASIKQEISASYVTIESISDEDGNVLGDYSTTSEMQNAITQAVSESKNSITALVSTVESTVNGLIKEHTIYYAVSDDSSYYPTLRDDGTTSVLDTCVLDSMVLGNNGSWTTDRPSVSSSEYLWQREYILYADGTEEWTDPVLLTDTTTRTLLESMAERTAELLLADTEIYTALTESVQQILTSDYSTTSEITNIIDQKIEDSEATITAQISSVQEAVDNSIQSYTPYYATSDSGNYYPTHGGSTTSVLDTGILGSMVLGNSGTWSTTQPDIEDGEYCWVSFYIEYTDGTTEWTTPTLLTDTVARDDIYSLTERTAALEMTLSSITLSVTQAISTAASYTDSQIEVSLVLMIEDGVGKLSGNADYISLESGDLQITSSQFTLDLNGNATFGGTLSANTVTATSIQSGAITTEKIAADAVTAEKIDVEILSAITADVGELTAGIIRSTNYTDDGSANGTSVLGKMVLGSAKLDSCGCVGIEINLDDGEIKSPYFEIDSNGNATFAGELQAATGTFSGELVAASGTFSGELVAASGTFSVELMAASGTFSGQLLAASGIFEGDLSAAGGTFSGALAAASGTFEGELVAATGTFEGNLVAAGGTFSGDLVAAGGTFTGTLSGVDGTFSGTLSAATGTFSGDISGASGTFTGAVNASSFAIDNVEISLSTVTRTTYNVNISGTNVSTSGTSTKFNTLLVKSSYGMSTDTYMYAPTMFTDTLQATNIVTYSGLTSYNNVGIYGNLWMGSGNIIYIQGGGKMGFNGIEFLTAATSYSSISVYLPVATGTDYLPVTQSSRSAGDSSTPVYVNSSGVITKCSYSLSTLNSSISTLNTYHTQQKTPTKIYSSIIYCPNSSSSYSYTTVSGLSSWREIEMRVVIGNGMFPIRVNYTMWNQTAIIVSFIATGEYYASFDIYVDFTNSRIYRKYYSLSGWTYNQLYIDGIYGIIAA